MKRKILLLSAVLLITSCFSYDTISAAVSKVPSDALTYKNHYYKVYKMDMTWKEAKKYCESMDGHLATLTYKEEADFVYELLKNDVNYNFWIGATDEVKEGNWRWVTGEEWYYTNWGDNQPDDSQLKTGIKEDYLQICRDWGSSANWNDSANRQDDTAKIGFVCEWDTDKPEPKKLTSISVSNITKNGFKASWKSVKADGYEIQYSTSKSFAKNKTIAIFRNC